MQRDDFGSGSLDVAGIIEVADDQIARRDFSGSRFGYVEAVWIDVVRRRREVDPIVCSFVSVLKTDVTESADKLPGALPLEIGGASKLMPPPEEHAENAAAPTASITASRTRTCTMILPIETRGGSR